MIWNLKDQLFVWTKSTQENYAIAKKGSGKLIDTTANVSISCGYFFQCRNWKISLLQQFLPGYMEKNLSGNNYHQISVVIVTTEILG